MNEKNGIVDKIKKNKKKIIISTSIILVTIISSIIGISYYKYIQWQRFNDYINYLNDVHIC